MILVDESTEEKPKKKRGRPKSAKSKPKLTESNEKSAKSPSSKTSLKSTKDAEAETIAKLAALRAAAEEASEKEYKAAEAEAVTQEVTQSFTNKRGQEVIFRRELGEPEFWLDKSDRAPTVPVLSQDEEAEISRKVEIPSDQTPPYKPEHILSPEFGGISNYEIGIKTQREELEQRLARLRGDPNASSQEIKQVEEDLKTLDYLFENFHDGMNVFRTAKGGRAKLRE